MIPNTVNRKTLGDRGALFDDERRHRYLLWSFWSDQPYLCVVGLNPSTADETRYDPTCVREVNRAMSAHYGGYVKVNLFSLKATNPTGMLLADDPGDDATNDLAVQLAAYGASSVLCAWGQHGTYRGRAAWIGDLLRATGTRMYHLGLTRNGQPTHPLYIPASRPMTRWE